jgi:mono/diheme cytochrome c family protein
MLAGCSSSSAASPSPIGFKIESSASSAVAGDAVSLEVVQTLSDGSTTPTPPSTTVTWEAPNLAIALAPGSTADNPLPEPGAQPTAVFVDNPSRPDIASALKGKLFILSAGPAGGDVHVSAAVSGVPTALTASISVGAAPDGSADRGASVYAANCATCHGDTGHGNSAAPGLNAEPGNPAADPDASAEAFAFVSRADVDPEGIAVLEPMPSFLTLPDPASKRLLTTQDFSDILAFLRTQTQ